MKLYLKHTNYNFFVYYNVSSSYFCTIDFDENTNKKIKEYISLNYKKYTDYIIAIRKNDLIKDDIDDCFKKYFENKIQYENFDYFHTIKDFIKSFFIDISEEDLFYIKLKYPNVFKEDFNDF